MRRPQRPDRPAVILLNGPPSSGKTTVAYALQRTLPQPFLRVGVEDFIAMHPERSALGSLVEARGGVRIALTPAGWRMMETFHAAVAAIVGTGQRVIIDDLILHPSLLLDWTDVLDPERVLFVGLRCPLDECERRERARPERDPGLARGYYEEAHAHGGYDLEVDTAAHPPEEAARLVAERWLGGPPPAALRELREREALLRGPSDAAP